MKAPEFWREDGFLAHALSPVGTLYALGGRLRQSVARPYRAPVPVICVGNLTAGGAGKTPVAIDLLKRLTARGVEAHAVSRGYRGSERGPHRVDPRKDSAARVGDEPLLLAAHAPCWVGRDRAAAIRAAVADGAGAIVMDDGFQNPNVVKALSLIVVDAGYGFGNDRVIPAGPLREPVAEGLARADGLLLLGEGEVPEAARGFAGPVLRGRLAPRFAGMSLTGARVFAFAGIGRPEKFFETVRRTGASLVDTEAFPDHHVYAPSMVNRLLARAREQNLMPVTTEKDMVKLPRSVHGKIWPVPVGVDWAEAAALEAVLDDTLGRQPGQ